MPGMHSGVNITNPILTAAFRSALMHQGLVALLLLAILATAWAILRESLPGVGRRRGSSAGLSTASTGTASTGTASTGTASTTPRVAATGRDAVPAEPAARTLIRYGFGLLWIFDGLLQAQPAMAAGLPSKVIAPAAASSPAWVKDVVNWAGTAWSYHPVQAGAATVWIQVGIGVWMLASGRGPASRLAGLAGAGWGLIVWMFGEAFGGIFGPGQSILFGTPGAAALYLIAGLLLALPERSWTSGTLARRLTAGAGVFFVAMAVLQAWPGRGFWQGTLAGRPGPLTTMVADMAGTPQPASLSGLLTGFASIAARDGLAVNLAAVLALALIGLGLLSGRRPLLIGAVAAATAFCLADWVLVQDLGFLGGLGTDPNSMPPMLLLVAAIVLAVVRPPAAVTEPTTAAARTGRIAAGAATARRLVSACRERAALGRLARSFASAPAQGVLASWAVVVIAIGAAPMALAQTSRTADPIIAQAIAGSTSRLDIPAYPISLTDQNGHPVSLTSLRGKVILLTFLDPVCTTDCPLIAQELRAADQLLGPRAARVEIVAVATNPLYYSQPYLRAFDRQERLTGLPNWLFLTGSVRQLRRVWNEYGIAVQVLPSGQMIAHTDIGVVIDAAGVIRAEFSTDPGPGTLSTRSSFAVTFAHLVEQSLAPAPAG
ncbi:MAG: SCO family protein [Actinomycetota bacterium]|nr:SCO family protein [Actinomycetota bacterium]